MSGTGFPGRDPGREDKQLQQLSSRLTGQQGSHVPLMPSPMQPTGDLIKTYHANTKVRPIVPALTSTPSGTIATAQVVTPSIIPKGLQPAALMGHVDSSKAVVTASINFSALQHGVSVATSQPIVSLSMSSVAAAVTQALTIPSVAAQVKIPMASIIRGAGVQQVIQQPVSQTSVTTHSTLIAPQPVQPALHQFPVHTVPRAALGGPKQQQTAVLRHATPVTAHLQTLPSTAVLSSLQPHIQPRGVPPMLPVRPTAPATPPVTRSGSPAVSVSVPSSQEVHRVGSLTQQSISTSTVSSVQFTIQQQRQHVVQATRPLNIPQPVLGRGAQHKVVMAPTTLAPTQQQTPVSSAKVAMPLNLQITTHGVSNTTGITTTTVANQPSIPIAKVPPQRQAAHQQSVQVREGREPVASALASLQAQALHRQSPSTTAPSTSSSTPNSLAGHLGHTDTRTDRSNLSHMPFMAHQTGVQNYEYYTATNLMGNPANLMSNPYLMYQPLAQPFSAGTTVAPIRPSIVPTQTPNLVATLQPAPVTTTQQGMRNPLVVTVDPSRHSHAQAKPATDKVITANATSSVGAVTSSTGLSHISSSHQAPVTQHGSPSQPPGGSNPTASPRPSILRKRPMEGVPMVKKSLASALSAMESGSPLSEVVSQSLTASPKPPGPFDPNRENSQSSTDTATSNDSTPPSAHGGDSKLTVKQEPKDDMENGPSGLLPITPIVNSNEASPRKKPRKQLLHATEELKDDSSTDDEVERLSAKMDLNRQLQKAVEEKQMAKFREMVDEYTDDEGVRWVRERKRPNISLLNHYTCSWKTKNNHFLRYQDVKCKEERRPTVNELSNQKGVVQKASGWKLYHLAGQLEEMMDMEKDIYTKLQEVQDTIAPKGVAKCTMEDDIGMVHELSQGSIQRCKLLADQLSEAKSSMIRILDHKPRVLEIIQKHHSKRPVKKKERN